MTDYAVVTRATYGPAGRRKAEELATRLASVYKAQPGFERADFLCFDDATGDFGSLVLFDSRAHAEAALESSQQTREQTTRELGIVRLGTPERSIAEVFASTT